MVPDKASCANSSGIWYSSLIIISFLIFMLIITGFQEEHGMQEGGERNRSVMLAHVLLDPAITLMLSL